MPRANPPDDIASLYREHFQALCGRIRKRFGAGPPDPEDAIQTAFARFTAIEDRARIQNPPGFLYRSAVNYVLDFRRRQNVSDRATAEIIAIETARTPVGHDISRVREAREELAVVMDAIQNLDPRRREILHLRFVEELSSAEIARRMNLSPTRVIQLYADAVARCAKALRDHEEST